MGIYRPLIVTGGVQSLPIGDLAQWAEFPAWGTGGFDFNAVNFLTGISLAQTNQKTSTFGSLSGSNKWAGGVLAPNGMIYGIPRNSNTVLKIDPTDDSVSTFGSLSGGGKWFGGVLAPNGVIYGIPYNSTTVLKIGSGFQNVSLDFCLARYFNKL
jgi:hypothetical protein